MPRRGTSWTAPHPCLIVRQVPSGDRRLHKTESAPATTIVFSTLRLFAWPTENPRTPNPAVRATFFTRWVARTLHFMNAPQGTPRP